MKKQARQQPQKSKKKSSHRVQYEICRLVPFNSLPTTLVDALFRAATQVVRIPKDLEFSVVIVSDTEIQHMNARYRGKQRPTDVLSFRYSDTSAEIVLSADRIRAQARDFGHSVSTEAAFLLVHGILHAVGYDHERSEYAYRTMRVRERDILHVCGLAYAR